MCSPEKLKESVCEPHEWALAPSGGAKVAADSEVQLAWESGRDRFTVDQPVEEVARGGTKVTELLL